jgi:hypothetical protein
MDWYWGWHFANPDIMYFSSLHNKYIKTALPRPFGLGNAMNRHDSNPLWDFLQVTNVDGCIVQAAIFNQLLPVAAHDALRW